MPQTLNGSDLVCHTLQSLGATHVFGVPGTQNVSLFEALRRSRLRTIATTSEMTAAFCALGHARVFGRPGILVTIPGPGFAAALLGLAEAKLDSVPMLHIVESPSSKPGNRYQHQAFDQSAAATPVTKGVIEIESTAEITAGLTRAYELALHGGPGPVLVQIHPDAIRGVASFDSHGAPQQRTTGQFDDAIAFLTRARRPVFLLGQGAVHASEMLTRLLSKHAIPTFTTASGRGVVPETAPHSLAYDVSRGHTAALNAGLQNADAILVLGCRLSHNGTAGFELQLPNEALVHVDCDSDVLGANYPAHLSVCADAAEFVNALARAWIECSPASTWTREEIGDWRQQLIPSKTHYPEPRFPSKQDAEAFFRALRAHMPENGIVVTDSGHHQTQTRRHYTVTAPNGLLMPTDLQSMGYGIPAAIGAKLAAPERPVVAIIGDGGFAMSGNELLTAARYNVPLAAFVFRDRKLGLIRLQQIAEYGHEFAADVIEFDLKTWAASAGIRFGRYGDGDTNGLLEAACTTTVPMLIDVPLEDSTAIRRAQWSGLARAVARRTLGARLRKFVGRLLKTNG